MRYDAVMRVRCNRLRWRIEEASRSPMSKVQGPESSGRGSWGAVDVPTGFGARNGSSALECLGESGAGAPHSKTLARFARARLDGERDLVFMFICLCPGGAGIKMSRNVSDTLTW